MSREVLNRNHQQNSDSENTIENQKKIDPEAQLNWLNNQQVDEGWGLDPVQMFGRAALESQQTESEIQMKQKGSLSNDIESVIQARFGTSVIQRETEEEINENEPESETEVYIVTNSDAIIRIDTEPHIVSLGNKIPLGTKIAVVDTFENKSRVQYVSDENVKYWTATSNFDKIESVSDTKLYTAFYNDIAIYPVPKGDATENVLEVDKKYSILNKREKFYEVKKEGEENAVGWIKDYEYVLYGEDKTDREDKLKEFKNWLGERLTEAEAKTGDEKIKFVQSILGLIEKESENIAKDNPVYPDIDNLDKLDEIPSYSETSNPDLNVAVPHELISITRDFIKITELTPVSEASETATTETTPTATETTETTAVETVTGGSRHSSNDWNSRLGAPQYRTQSDNMSIPEITCNVTTMSMTLERLGNSRNDVITAIDTKLKNGEEKTDAQLKTLWEEKSKAYLEKITSDAGSKDYKKIRAGSNSIGSSGGDLVGKENELSKKFKEIAQIEDLLDFYMYLKTSDLENRYSIFNNAYNDVIPEEINPSTENKYKTKRIDVGNKGKRFKNEHRYKIKETLDGGGSVVMSVYHKGTGTKSHIISVQSLTAEGLYVDDPYGGQAEDYRYGVTGDLFAGKSKTDRSDFKNVIHDNVLETDYTKRDFTVEAGQNLKDDESRGDSILLKYEMINESTSEFINYIVLYEKN